MILRIRSVHLSAVQGLTGPTDSCLCGRAHKFSTIAGSWSLHCSFVRSGERCAVVPLEIYDRLLHSITIRKSVTSITTVGPKATAYDILELMGRVQLGSEHPLGGQHGKAD